MEPQEENTPVVKRKSNWKMISIAAIGLAIAIYIFSKKSKTIYPGGVLTEPDYLHGYWKWAILTTTAWRKATFDKARLNKIDILEQLNEDAELKIESKTSVGDDFKTFKTLVDNRVSSDTSNISYIEKFNNAINYIIEQAKLIAVKSYNDIIKTDNKTAIKTNSSVDGFSGIIL